MNERYKRFNEITFISYCLVSIDRAIVRGLRRKQLRAHYEIPLSTLPESLEPSYELQHGGLSDMDAAAYTFMVGGHELPVMDEALALALRSIPPKRREIVLLAYLLGKSDAEISRELKLSRTTARDRRRDAIKRLRELLGGKA